MDNYYTNLMYYPMMPVNDNMTVAAQNNLAFHTAPPIELFAPPVKESEPLYYPTFYSSPQSSTSSFSSTQEDANKPPEESNESLTEDSEDEKKSKQKSLERNRLAAFKCRQRKKEWVEELAKKTERLTRENTYLKNLIFQLKEEALFIKTQLLLHKQNEYPACKNKAYLNFI